MDAEIDNLIGAVERQARAAAEEMAAKPNDGRADWAAITPSTAAPLASAIRAIPALAALEGRMYVLPRESGLINFDSAAVYLLDRAQRTAPEIIARDLVRLAEEESVTLSETRLIVGVKPTKRVDLGGGFSLTPPDQTPSHDYAPDLFSPSNRPSHGWGGPPTAALVRRWKCNLELHLPRDVQSGGMVSPVIFQQSSTPERDWNAALLACALASDAAPQFRQGYEVIEDPGWVGMRSNSLGGSEAFPVRETQASFFEEDKVPHFFERLRNENKTIDLALNRLINSRRRPSYEERALDLGTCIEVLLMSGSKDNGEISYKIGTRAAWLIGKDAADRMRVFRAARELYGDRSIATHTGSLREPRSMEETMAQHERFRTFDRLCADILSSLLDRGVPDSRQWASIVLNVSS